MIARIYRLFSFVFLSIFLILSINLNGPEISNAIEPFKLDVAFSAIGIDDEKTSMSLDPIEQNSDLTSKQNEDLNQSVDETRYPDLGDDQVFPFVAGLDSYEGRS